MEVAAGHSDCCGPLVGGLKVDVQRTWSIKRSQHAEAVADSAEEDGEFGAVHDSLFVLEFGWGEEVDSDGGWGRFGSRGQAQGCGFEFSGDQLGCFFEDEAFRGGADLEGSYSLEVGLASPGANAFTGEGGEGEDEVGEDFLFSGENVDVEMKGLAGLDDVAVEVAGAEDEGAGQVGETAGGVFTSEGFEDGGVGTGFANFAGSGVAAVGDAGEAAEDVTEGSAQSIGGFAGGKENRVAGNELETQGIKLKLHGRGQYSGKYVGRNGWLRRTRKARYNRDGTEG